ncbi:MAG: PhzF family phenazine biosynthesis protein [Kordiimonadaceae bacterium]|nr:PhzF family phenazine biosynthesis protein [Kordiimonadaceae bacterium]
MKNIPYFHVDVFASQPFTGNSLAVFHEPTGLDAAQMLTVTQEMQHFETIFLEPTNKPDVKDARVFDLFEELDFAGHPLLGAAAVLHHTNSFDEEQLWTFNLPQKTVTVRSRRRGDGYQCMLDQGTPEFLGQLGGSDIEEVCRALNLETADIVEDLPLEVVSTGLRYLIVPVRGALAKTRIVSSDFGELLKSFGAQFAYILDVDLLEGRHWNNDGIQEDVATGSAAGTVGAYLARHGRKPLNQEFTLKQGGYLGRPSEIRVRPIGTAGIVDRIQVGGDVALVASCILLSEPKGGER